ncbi:Pth1p [Sugiyamaella lignohabitans]|uniref:Pth1p n=1 Tax=Sugiyamaella lignohabitans TaxID=796027 RepID=A0A167FSK8_9ASCO|nr:Pth1p [Sugiyamaella lignohabitans]ANB15649.1 Pth1p [Sugiyamaella lignohabitans]
MNTSGRAVKAATRWFHNEHKIYQGSDSSLIPKFLIFHDDLDIGLGEVKLKQPSRASRGHNGLKSISEVLQEDYPRLRVGIGRPGKSKDTKVISDYVLGRFKPSEEDVLANQSVPQTLELIDAILSSGVIYQENDRSNEL